MEFLLGLSVATIVYLIYDKRRTKATVEELSPQLKEKIKEEQEHFENLFNYDIKKAYGGK